MPLHLIKLCVGASSIAELAEWQTQRRQAKTANGRPCVYHTTFQAPKREAELLSGGSLYWVMKGTIAARQRLVGFEEGKKDDGTPCCLLLLSPRIVPVRPTPRRAFQGWRYLAAEDAPADLSAADGATMAAMPAKLRKQLADLGLI